MNLEMVHNYAMRFIARIKGTGETRQAVEKLKLPTLQLRKQKKRMTLLIRVVKIEDTRPALVQSYDDL